MITSLRTLISVTCVSIVIGALAISGCANYLVTRSYDDRSIQETLESVSEGHTGAIDDWVSAKTLSIIAVQQSALEADPIPIFKAVAEAGGFIKIYAGYPDKVIKLSDSSIEPPGYDPTARPWFIKAVQEGKPTVTSPYIAASSGKLVVTFAAPVFRNGKLAAVVAGDVSMDAVIANVRTIHPSAESFGFLINPVGKIIAYPDTKLTMKSITEVAPTLTPEAIEAIDGGKHTVAEISGEPKLLYRRIIKGTDWSLIVALDKADATQGIRSLVATSIYMLIGIAAVAALIASALTSRIFRRLSIIRDAMYSIGSGEGDLTKRLPTAGRDEVAQIARSFNTFVDKLTHVLRSIQSGSDSVRSAAQEIAAGNTDLSQRTEEQAASLQETAASMEQLKRMVRSNSESAHTARRLAVSASDIAVQGGRVINGVVETMGEINESSGKVVSIVEVIDSIAFQTNILALNAAVEAARAGEQGRGFAVVAAEVRVLAKRSASAASEIKGLIDDSLTRVTTGSQLVSQAGRTMTEIIDAVSNVAAIVGEISAASEQQSHGIGHVCEAVNQMDQVTQQNAALVEQAAASAASLGDQARSLNDAISTFGVGNT